MSLIQIRTDATKAIQDYDIDVAFFNTSNMLALAKENIWKTNSTCYNIGTFI